MKFQQEFLLNARPELLYYLYLFVDTKASATTQNNNASIIFNSLYLKYGKQAFYKIELSNVINFVRGVNLIFLDHKLVELTNEEDKQNGATAITIIGKFYLIADKFNDQELWLLALTVISTSVINLEMDMQIQGRFLLNSKIMKEASHGPV